ncbi:MAG: MFS transporter [Candidatus Bathyarchaeia archaeon]
MQTAQLKTLTIVSIIYFFTSNLSGMFLPIYFKESGLSLTQIVQIMSLMFVVVGLLPVVLLKLFKNFERIISLGILLTMLFYVTLIYVKEPAVLGLTYGLSIATFWPSFNLLQFRFSESKVRARTVSFFSMIVPSVSGALSPAVGGFIIESFGFSALFVLSVFMYLSVFVLSTRIKVEAETHEIHIPKDKMFVTFFATFIVTGLIDSSYWLVYPLFVHKISEGSILNMGLVFTFSSILVSAITFFVNWLSDIKGKRVEFAIVSSALYFLWYFALAFTSTMYEIVALSLLSGLAGAFSFSWFAYYGDYFLKEYYASILVVMEVGLMIGRLINLASAHLFISVGNYPTYFMLSGVFSLFMIPFLVSSMTSQKTVNHERLNAGYDVRCNWLG